MIDLLLEPLTYSFMQRGLTAALMVGVVSALVGTFVMLRGMAFFGDALAHAILPGVAFGYITSTGGPGGIFWWGLGTAIITSLGIGALSRHTRIKEDTSIGIFFAGMFALGIAMISSMGSYAVDLSHFLFGNVLGVSNQDLLITATLGGAVVIITLAFYKEFMVMAFDPVLATTLRLPTRFLENLLLILIAVTIVVSLQTVGIALMVAMLITPAATAYLLTRRLHIMMILAALFAVLAGLSGLYLSFYISIASGAAIVLVSTLLFVLVWLAQSLFYRNNPK
jgi:manganese/iron transport system permease protein